MLDQGSPCHQTPYQSPMSTSQWEHHIESLGNKSTVLFITGDINHRLGSSKNSYEQTPLGQKTMGVKAHSKIFTGWKEHAMLGTTVCCQMPML